MGFSLEDDPELQNRNTSPLKRGTWNALYNCVV